MMLLAVNIYWVFVMNCLLFCVFYVYLVISFWRQSYEAGTVVIPILLLRKLKHTLSGLPVVT